MKFNDNTDMDLYSIGKKDKEETCYICNKKTQFYDICSKLPVCSSECLEEEIKIMYGDY